MAQERGEGFGTGMFPSNRNPAASYVNRQRRPIKRKLVRSAAISARQLGKKRGPYKVRSPKRDEVALWLSIGLDFPEIATRMGITPKAAQRHFDKICKSLGPQAR